MRHAGAYWRARSKAGEAVDARIINTSSGAGLQGSVGQATYSAAKAGIAALTLVAAARWPHRRDRQRDRAVGAHPDDRDGVRRHDGHPGQDFDAMAPENVSPLVVWLGSVQSRDVTGQVFEVEGGKIRVAEGWGHGPQIDKGARWDPAELGPVVSDLLSQARPRCRSTGPEFAQAAASWVWSAETAERAWNPSFAESSAAGASPIVLPSCVGLIDVLGRRRRPGPSASS
jgi:hypothetical protein